MNALIQEYEKIGYMEQAEESAAQAKDEPLRNRILSKMPGLIIYLVA